MHGYDELVAVVREWVVKAENDLKNAAHTLKPGQDCPTDAVCFHAQQCVGKYLKALLVWRCVRFPKTHCIGALHSLVRWDGRPEISPEEQERLTDFATSTRYPDVYESISLNEAHEAVKLARRVRRDIRRLLPREAQVRRGH
ncbi:MAG: HEPN domain-containing protein [Candidatus Hydrogenedentes bacterium]|nr:HEPN domain-containing protein [Candidatus Hydrogenedentota bacterium]